MKAYNEIKKELEARKDRSAWSKRYTVRPGTPGRVPGAGSV